MPASKAGALPLGDSPTQFGGAEGIRTPDPQRAKLVLYQLSYRPAPWLKIMERVMGIEPT